MGAERLSALDASFLALESPTAHMHVGWAAVLSPPETGPRPGFEELRNHVAGRLCRAPRYRQKLAPVPLGIRDPLWADDESFDIDRHVFEAKAGAITDVLDLVMSTQLPRDRPLWELWIAPRLEDGRVGVVGKAHHCMVDGIAAVELAALLLDPSPEPPPPEPDGWEPASPPGPLGRVAGGVLDLAREQLELATLPARLMRSPERIRGYVERADRAARALAQAFRPATLVSPLNKPISPYRRLVTVGRPLDDLKRIKRHFGVTINDVVLAVSAGGVRRFLEQRGQRPISLKTMVPVNLRDEQEDGEFGNRISFIFVDLPCDEPDPVRRLREINQATRARKELGVPEGSDAVLKLVSYAPTPLQRAVSRLVASPRTFNLVVSNIPGPREPLYMLGCLLEEAYPVVPLADRHALSIGITTIRDGAFFGIYADRDRLPDAHLLAADLDESIGELLARTRKPRRREATPAEAGVPVSSE
jgi:diacylglycerol O-acyltransferase